MDLLSLIDAVPAGIGVPLCIVSVIAVVIVVARVVPHHRARPGRLRNGVDGTGRIVSVSTYRRHGTTQGLVTIDLVVEAPGMPATAVTYKRMIMVPRWPEPGDVVPISVDPRQPSRCVILWGELPDLVAIGHARAQQLAADLRASAGTTPASESSRAHSSSLPLPEPVVGEQKVRVDSSGCSIVGPDGALRRIESLSELEPPLREKVRGVWENASQLLADPEFEKISAARREQIRGIVANLGYLFR